MDRCDEKIDADTTPIGYLPRLNDLNTAGLSLSNKELKNLLAIEIGEWKKEVKDLDEFFKKFKTRLPKEIIHEHDALKRRLGRRQNAA